MEVLGRKCGEGGNCKKVKRGVKREKERRKKNTGVNIERRNCKKGKGDGKRERECNTRM